MDIAHVSYINHSHCDSFINARELDIHGSPVFHLPFFAPILACCCWELRKYNYSCDVVGCISSFLIQPKGALAISATYVLHQAIEAFTGTDKLEHRGSESAVVTCKLGLSSRVPHGLWFLQSSLLVWTAFSHHCWSKLQRHYFIKIFLFEVHLT